MPTISHCVFRYFYWSFFSPQEAQPIAETVYVSPGGGHIPPYTNWVEAATNIQNALDVARDGDVVLLEATTFYQYETLRITNAVTLRSNGWATYLQGPYYSSIYITGIRVEHPDAVLDGLSLSYFGGEAVTGGCVHLASPAMLTNCTLSSGYSSRGGGVYAAPSAAGSALINCQFNYNMAWDSGGGLYAAASCTVYGCDFRYNYTYTNAGPHGRAVRRSFATATFTTTTFTGRPCTGPASTAAGTRPSKAARSFETRAVRPAPASRWKAARSGFGTRSCGTTPRPPTPITTGRGDVCPLLRLPPAGRPEQHRRRSTVAAV